jgi:hypothetical protein
MTRGDPLSALCDSDDRREFETSLDSAVTHLIFDISQEDVICKHPRIVYSSVT